MYTRMGSLELERYYDRGSWDAIIDMKFPGYGNGGWQWGRGCKGFNYILGGNNYEIEAMDDGIYYLADVGGI